MFPRMSRALFLLSALRTCHGFQQHASPVSAFHHTRTAVTTTTAPFVRRDLVTLPNQNNGNIEGERKSVTGIIYTSEQQQEQEKDPLVIQLFTKEGCTLCDKVTDVLRSIQSTHPHTLEAVDITDPDKTEIYDKYKYDIPVLHMNSQYWTKHRLTAEEAIEAIQDVSNNPEGYFFTKPKAGEPNAGEMERRQMERMQKDQEEPKEEKEKSWFE